jgi:hypothetical protein
MKTKVILCLILAMATLLSYCTKDFIEPNISSKWVYIVSPQNNVTTSSVTPTFWWNLVDGARTYNLQIVSPSFASSNQFILDTMISGNKFVWTLQSSKTYQWRVAAFNTVSSTPYTTYTLSTDSTSNLLFQTVVITQPAQSPSYTNASVETIKWNAILAAKEYRLIVTNQGNNSNIKDTTLTTTSFSTVLQQGSYLIQVRAQNSFSNTQYASVVVNVNRIPPAPSSLLTPADGASITGSDTLKWVRASGTVSDSIFINTDSLFVSVSPITPVVSSVSTYVLTTAQSGTTYYWRIKSGDAEGNWSGFSSKRKFIQH